MPKLERFTLVWLRGFDCEGCTISALGDTTAGGIEVLLAGKAPGLPPVQLFHPLLALENGAEFVHRMRQTERGEFGPYGLIVETSITDDRLMAGNYACHMGDEEGRDLTLHQWLVRLAPGAAVVLAWGDCAVWGGPHSLGVNPASATGVGMMLPIDYKSTWGLPVINLPGCAAPPVFVDVVQSLLRWKQGEGPPIRLDDVGRPEEIYQKRWQGALSVWAG